MDFIYKNFSVTSKAIDADGGVYSAMISIENTDRQGDVVRATGGRFENYLKNPVVLWAHDYSDLPVAKTTNLEIIPGEGIRATFQFPEMGTSEKADAVRRLWSAGFLGATSIGFTPLKASPTETGWDFQEWEMLEFSIVPVPANAEALRLAIKTIEGIPADNADEPSEPPYGKAEANDNPPPHDETEVLPDEALDALTNALNLLKEKYDE